MTTKAKVMTNKKEEVMPLNGIFLELLASMNQKN